MGHDDQNLTGSLYNKSPTEEFKFPLPLCLIEISMVSDWYNERPSCNVYKKEDHLEIEFQNPFRRRVKLMGYFCEDVNVPKNSSLPTGIYFEEVGNLTWETPFVKEGTGQGMSHRMSK